MSNSTGFYPSVRVDSAGTGVVSQAGGLILTDTVRASGLGAGLSVGCGIDFGPGQRVLGALGLMTAVDGSTTEAISETTTRGAAQDRCLFTTTAGLLEDLDLTRGRQVGKHAWILTTSVPAAN